MNVLSMNFNHDGSAAVLRDGAIAGYVNTERRSRLKKHPGVRTEDIEALLCQSGLAISDLDLVVLLNLNFMDTDEIPTLHGSDLKQTWPEFWIDKTYTRVRLLDHVVPCVIPRQHHVFHAALAYYFSPFESGVSLACDPLGSEAHFFSKGRRLPSPPARRRIVSPQVYGLVARRMFGSELIGAGKLMGLAPYGAADKKRIDYAELAATGPADAFRSLVELTAQDYIEVRAGNRALNASLAYHTQALLEWELTRLLGEL